MAEYELKSTIMLYKREAEMVEAGLVLEKDA